MQNEEHMKKFEDIIRLRAVAHASDQIRLGKKGAVALGLINLTFVLLGLFLGKFSMGALWDLTTLLLIVLPFVFAFGWLNRSLAFLVLFLFIGGETRFWLTLGASLSPIDVVPWYLILSKGLIFLILAKTVWTAAFIWVLTRRIAGTSHFARTRKQRSASVME